MGTFLLCVALVLVLVLAACTHFREFEKPVTVDDIVKSAMELEGTSVTVNGYLDFDYEARNLWSNKGVLSAIQSGNVPVTDPSWNRCVALHNYDKWRKFLQRRNKSNVVVTGIVRIFREKDYFLLGACSEIGISISSIHVFAN